ncbi:GATA transcription factor 6-like [Zingiber officinale]|uniref:GATA transcription factor 6-like n=1 Tax=Zingiber officinale TaxID=94328 RepID=UPI001C4B91AC|nr:GATA transcription factor 6-like [Zingiber officinale]
MRIVAAPSPLRSTYSKMEEEPTMEEGVERAAEGGSLLWGDDFSVDDLLNLEVVENEEEEEGDDEDGEIEAVEHEEGENSNSSSVSFEPPAVALHGLTLPAHDAAEFEWVSFFMDDSLSEFPSCSGVALSASADGSLADGGALAGNSRKGASFLSSAVCILSTEAKVPTKAKRSKRPCRGAAPWSMTIGHLFQESPSNSTVSSSSSSSSAPIIPPFLAHAHPPSADRRRFLLRDIPPPAKTQKPKKRGRKPKKPAAEAVESHGQRRCAHCGAHKTPQWRAGPLGAKTLCNACGVRFKSGRLLPEYRPACSPTFVGYIHSNCHRKVLEMRRKKEAPPPVPTS